MKIKVLRSKFIESLESINKIIAEHSSKMVIITETIKESRIESSALFRERLVKEYNTGKNQECPLCESEINVWENPFGGENLYECKKCRIRLPAEIYEQKAFHVSEKGVADFVARTIGDIGCAQPIGERNYRLGTFYGRDAYFCASPKEGFFNSLTKDALVITCDDSAVPRGWASNGCTVIRFAELFYTKNELEQIRVADSVLKKIKNHTPARRFDKSRQINDRRDKWLTVISHILANGYRASDFHKGKLTAAAAYAWFKKVYPRFNKVARTLDRDMAAFHTVEKKEGAYDKREPVIAKLLETIADDSIPQDRRLEIANNIKNAVAKLKEAERRNGGNPVELPPTGWITDESGRSVAVPTTTDDATFEAVAMREKLKSLKITAA